LLSAHANFFVRFETAKTQHDELK